MVSIVNDLVYNLVSIVMTVQELPTFVHTLPITEDSYCQKVIYYVYKVKSGMKKHVVPFVS